MIIKYGGCLHSKPHFSKRHIAIQPLEAGKLFPSFSPLSAAVPESSFLSVFSRVAHGSLSVLNPFKMFSEISAKTKHDSECLSTFSPDLALGGSGSAAKSTRP